MRAVGAWRGGGKAGTRGGTWGADLLLELLDDHDMVVVFIEEKSLLVCVFIVHVCS